MMSQTGSLQSLMLMLLTGEVEIPDTCSTMDRAFFKTGILAYL